MKKQTGRMSYTADFKKKIVSQALSSELSAFQFAKKHKLRGELVARWIREHKQEQAKVHNINNNNNELEHAETIDETNAINNELEQQRVQLKQAYTVLSNKSDELQIINIELEQLREENAALKKLLRMYI